MPADDLQPFGEYEWSTAHEKLLLPASHAGEICVRVRYRRRGSRVYRSFLLIGELGNVPEREVVERAIAEHAAQ